MDAPARKHTALLQELSSTLSPASRILANEPLAPKTTLRVGGPADFFVEPACEEDLAALARFCSENQVPWFVIGRGSNLLVKDGGIRGVVISLAHPQFSRIEFEGERVTCGAGARLKTVAVEARRRGVAGFEFFEGIPGTVGGALRMNAGAMGSATFETVRSIRMLDASGNFQNCNAAEIFVEYRSCPVLKNHIAVSAVLEGRPAATAEVDAKMREFSRKRWDSQPAAPSAGCIFKNPVTIPAGKLVEELGLKGTRVGGAIVSAEHGNFIVNDRKATAADVLELIEIIKDKARRDRGIDLKTEVEIVGE
ncbi:MAG TPA: UDP-N-acetylmuramate dehydrogenase [Verrucomicrobiae bacterium]|nr:UDP-N-acetylmuramate dehydrogenase [Verrucomicrobiae bacterium]